MLQVLLIFQVVVTLCMIGLVLVQHGKGADMGASFGAGASNTVFGSSGSTPFLVKITIVLAVLYFANSLGIGYMTAQSKKAHNNPTSSLLTAHPSTSTQGFNPATTSQNPANKERRLPAKKKAGS